VPEAIVDRLETNALSVQHVAEHDGLIPHRDGAGMPNATELEVLGVFRVTDVSRERTRARFVAGRGGLHPQGFVRPLFVERPPPAFERVSLLRPRILWRRGDLGLERSMHAFMTTVLLGVSWLGALGKYAELDPPDAEGRQPADGGGGKGAPVVASHPQRQAVLAKRGLEHWLRSGDVFGLERLAAQHEPTVRIGDRERVAIALLDAEFALEVGAPDDIWRRCRGQRERRLRCPPSPSSRLDHPVALQDVGDRAATRPNDLGLLAMQVRLDLLRAPCRVARPQRDDRALDIGGHRMRHVVRRRRLVDQIRRAAIQEALHPLVARLPRHLKLST